MVGEADQPLKILAVANWDFEASPNPWAIQRVEALRAGGVEVEVLSEECVTDRRGYLRLWRRLNQRLTASHFDVVAPFYGSLNGLLCVSQRRVPVAIHFAGTDINGQPTPGRITLKSLAMPMSQLTAALANGVAVASRGMRESLWWPPARKAARVIEFGVDTRRFRPMPRDEARRRRGLPLEGIRVAFVTVGGGDERRKYKRLDLARQAVERVPGAVIDVLEMVPFAEMPVAYAASNALILTSVAEGSPNCVKEALACGIPVVSTDVGDVREVISGLTNCAVVAADAEALGRALAAAIADGRGCPEGPMQMAAGHSLDSTVRSFIGFYSHVARRNGRAG